jgi:osmotically-inducible protein OsmY
LIARDERSAVTASISLESQGQELDLMDQEPFSGHQKPAYLRGISGKGRDTRRDGEVVKAAQEQLQASGYSDLRSITCEFREGVVVLRGRVTSFYLKQLAQETVRPLVGARAILNAVEVA